MIIIIIDIFKWLNPVDHPCCNRTAVNPSNYFCEWSDWLAELAAKLQGGALSFPRGLACCGVSESPHFHARIASDYLTYFSNRRLACAPPGFACLGLRASASTTRAAKGRSKVNMAASRVSTGGCADVRGRQRTFSRWF